MRLDLVFRKDEEVEELIATLVTLEVGLLQHCSVLKQSMSKSALG